ncbi:FliH/SctL family protein [Acidocella sp.]|uniref:FliH/SctL family protein n=1 Tax=Acidocella sp. TaxID=50710 RepID=UPI00261C1DE7|nr:FliH/SctL family protein [Acidocella sp.]
MSFVRASRQRETSVQHVLTADTAELAARDAEVQRRVKQEVARLRESVMAEAKAAGEMAAQEQMALSQAALAQALSALAEAQRQMEAPLAVLEDHLAELCVEMAFLLARHIAGGESGSARAELAGLVKRLLHDAAAEAGPGQTLLLRLNPADAARLQPALAGREVKIIADDAISPGGALVEMRNAAGDPLDRTEWDARLENRLAAIRAALDLPGDKP